MLQHNRFLANGEPSYEEVFKREYTPSSKKQEQRKAARQKERAEHKRQRAEQGRSVAYQMYRTIQHFFPNLFEWMREIQDCRSSSDYELAEIITACLAMFLFKTGSRNELNNLRTAPKFCKNYKKLFKLRLPHPDTVNNVMKALPETHLETLKRRMIQALLNKKALHKFRFQGRFVVAIDGTGVVSFDHKHCDRCLHRTSKGGKTTWFHNVLEAKLILRQAQHK